MTLGGTAMDNFFKYMRISTKEERGLQKYNRQEAALNKYAADNGIEYVAEFHEDESGKSFENRNSRHCRKIFVCNPKHGGRICTGHFQNTP